MLKKVAEAFSRFDLLKNRGRITVALSGGADSMALLYALTELKEELNITQIEAAHFNHKIRGAEAESDQSFVASQCKKLGIKLHLGCADVPKYASENHLSVELAARKLRYDFFDTLDTDAIATAHTASDNIETVIFNLTRGTALSGLCGIPPKRDRYIRPLILCSREEIENYCKLKGISFVTDSTNLCDDYTRNKIRHSVVPILKSINNSAEIAVSRMTCSIREDEDFINAFALKKYFELCKDGKLNVADFKILHISPAKRIIAKYCADSGVEADNFHINQIYNLCIKCGKTSLPGNKYACVKNGVLEIVPADKHNEEVSFKVQITESDNNLFEKNKKVHNLLLKNILDCDKIIGKLVLRQKMSGDKIKLKNKNCTKTLKKLFCEYKIPIAERKVWPVICDDCGIIWVYKIGVADRCAADETSKKLYVINVDRFQGGKLWKEM